MPQNMGVASSIPMQTWDPMLTRFMQRDYNAHVDSAAIAAAHHGGMFVEDPALTAMGIGGMGMGGMGAISGLDTSRTPTLQLPGKFARASDPSAWASFASLSDFPPLLRRKYEPKEQIGRCSNCNLSTVFLSLRCLYLAVLASFFFSVLLFPLHIPTSD